MRIGIFTDYYVPRTDGTAIAAEIMRDELVKQGHVVYVFCPDDEDSFAKDTRIRTYRSLGLSMYDELRISQPYRRRNIQQIKKLKLDFVHVHTPASIGLFGFKVAKKTGVPVAMTFHLDMDFMKKYGVAVVMMPALAATVSVLTKKYWQFFRIMFSGSIGWRAYGLLASQCDLAVMPSQKIYDQMSHYAKTGNFLLLPNAVSLEGYKVLDKSAARQKLKIDSDAKIVITTSRLVREKRLDSVIRAFSAIAKQNPKAQLYIVGDGPEMGSLKQLADKLQLGSKVIFAGKVTRQAVFGYLSAADIYVNACFHEVSSLSVLEAAMLAKPLILSDRRLIEPLEDGLNGYFVDTPKALGQKVTWLFDNPDLAKKMGDASKKRASNFKPEVQIKKLVGEYQKIISGRR